jgi:hypothetical protein
MMQWPHVNINADCSRHSRRKTGQGIHVVGDED